MLKQNKKKNSHSINLKSQYDPSLGFSEMIIEKPLVVIDDENDGFPEGY